MAGKSDKNKPDRKKSDWKKPGKRDAKTEKKKKKQEKRERPGGEPESRLRAVLEQIGPDFIEESARRMSFKDLEQIAAHAAEVLEQFETKSALRRFQTDGATMLDLVLDFVSGRFRGGALWAVGVAGFTLAYVRKPIDIIPDSLPVIGQLDDAIVFSHALAMIKPHLRSYRVWKLASEVEGG